MIWYWRYDSGSRFWLVERLPFPGQQFEKPALWGASDPGQHVDQPSKWIDIVELGGGNQRRRSRSPSSTAVRAGEEPRLSAQGKTSEGPLGSIIRKANSTVVEEASEPVAALKHIVDWPGDGGRARQTRALLTQPSFQIVHKLPASFLSDTQTILDTQAVDGAGLRCALPLPAQWVRSPAPFSRAGHWPQYRPARRTDGAHGSNRGPR